MNGYIFIVMAFIIESVWETLKNIVVKGKVSKDRVGTIIIALVVVFVSNIDIIDFFGVNMRYGVGKILTAILISRGSNFTHDLVSLISNEYQYRKSNNVD
ncbi:hypothetical protein [Haloimpatiens lingqiaonensis]|uniref:hypothetical protein n=1 Tax=Haloimpatiens lingqiaonensis TaxID=1380675 RepID=UPI0010FE8159|nr:hypothetical protein [Haloimpatiens lingqiaonensis]